MNLLKTAALAAGLACVGAMAPAATYDFGALADAIGEGSWGSQPAAGGTVAGGTWDGSSYSVDGISVTATAGSYDSASAPDYDYADAWAYLDSTSAGRQAGLGVCSGLTGDECDPSNDDNTGIAGGTSSSSTYYEFLRLVFDSPVFITDILLRDDNHRILTSGLIGYGDGSIGSPAGLSIYDIASGAFTSGVASNVWYFARIGRGVNFYIDGLTVEEVPLPAAGLMLLGGLGGLAALRRRKV